MRVTRKDVIPTVLVGAILVAYIGYVMRGSMPFIEDARGMAATGLILLLAWGVLVRTPFGQGAVAWVAAGLGIGALGLGIWALLAESDAVLVPFMAAIVALWVLRMTILLGAFSDKGAGGRSPIHA